jgi:Holliday junction resolvasome RuvABC DNA-binding subunit
MGGDKTPQKPQNPKLFSTIATQNIIFFTEINFIVPDAAIRISLEVKEKLKDLFAPHMGLSPASRSYRHADWKWLG